MLDSAAGQARPWRIAILSHTGGDELSHGLSEAFSANGCAVEILTPDGPWPQGIDLHLIYGPMAPISPLLVRLRSLPQRPRVAVWYTEPLPPFWPDWQLRGAVALRGMGEELLQHSSRLLGPERSTLLAGTAGRLRACAEMRSLQRWGMLELLAVFTQRHVQLFGAWGLPTEVIPMGACSSFGRLMEMERTIDVAFIGSTRDRRRRPLVAKIMGQLATAGVRTVVKDGSPEHGYVFGPERAELLNRTKILLSIMRQPWDDPVFRMLLTAPNGAMVLSEPVAESAPFVAGRHFAVAALDEMLPVVRHYLAAEDERRTIADAAQQLVSQELTMAAMAQRLLHSWQRRVSHKASASSFNPEQSE